MVLLGMKEKKLEYAKIARFLGENEQKESGRLSNSPCSSTEPETGLQALMQERSWRKVYRLPLEGELHSTNSMKSRFFDLPPD